MVDTTTLRHPKRERDPIRKNGVGDGRVVTIGTYSPTISNFVGIGPGTGIIGTQGAWARLHSDDGDLLYS